MTSKIALENADVMLRMAILRSAEVFENTCLLRCCQLHMRRNHPEGTEGCSCKLSSSSACIDLLCSPVETSTSHRLSSVTSCLGVLYSNTASNTANLHRTRPIEGPSACTFLQSRIAQMRASRNHELLLLKNICMTHTALHHVWPTGSRCDPMSQQAATIA